MCYVFHNHMFILDNENLMKCEPVTFDQLSFNGFLVKDKNVFQASLVQLGLPKFFTCYLEHFFLFDTDSRTDFHELKRIDSIQDLSFNIMRMAFSDVGVQVPSQDKALFKMLIKNLRKMEEMTQNYKVSSNWIEK